VLAVEYQTLLGLIRTLLLFLMFRPTKKRPRKPAIVRTLDDDNDDDESPDETTVKRPRKKKLTRPAVMSFDVDAEEASPKKKKKRKNGMGFGGAPAIVDTQEDEEMKNEQDGAIHGSEPTTSYGKDALNKLKSQQKYKPREEKGTHDAMEETSASTSMPPPVVEPHNDSSYTALPSFIPLSSKQEHVILTGDEALEYETIQQSAPLHTTTEDMVLDAEQAEESSAWEAQVASRAGIRTTTRPRMPTTETSSISSLTKLRDQVKSALTQLEHQTEDVQNASARREVEVTQVREELTRQEAELEQAGSALEYYQVLREQLASWVGALRELRTKVMPLQEALHKVERLGGNRWTDWQDDVVSILHEANLLDRVLGRQPSQEDTQVTTVVDEFGRDVKSQYVLQRDKRVKQRRAIRRQRTVRDDDSDALLSDGEQVEMKTRRDALREALSVAMEDVDEEFTKLSNLIAIFAKWANTYPEEYRQCFASMSLADLASVLVQADLCSAHHPLRWQNATEELPWLKDLKTIPVDDATEEQDTPSCRMADKVLIPILLEVLDEGAYHILSTKESRSLAAFYWRICRMFPKDNPLTLLLRGRIVKYLKGGLDNIAIPIIKRDAKNQSPSEDVQEAVTYATSGQVRRIEKLLCNILAYWKLESMAEPVLDFIVSKYLFLLSSLQAQGMSEIAPESFARVWKGLQATGWLERPEFMLQAAPIRAAARVYDI